MRTEHRIPGLPEPFSHYTDVVRDGRLVFLSGMIAVDEAGRVVGAGDPLVQARQVLKHLGRGLATVGAGPEHVAKVTVFLTDVGHRQAVDVARREFFGETRPASTLVQVSALILPECLIEIEAMAVLPDVM